ncbi:hypothetical protein [Nocardioides psychrotolerans]|uniref:hypothetical protein n=1 Tax=Nocardioides psychrotolerans TaxID=1005945 RepID=UPI003137F848
MFAHTCTACSTRYLIFPSQVTGIRNSAEGVTVDFVCWCDAPQSQVTGKAAGRRHREAVAA